MCNGEKIIIIITNYNKFWKVSFFENRVHGEEKLDRVQNSYPANLNGFVLYIGRG